MPVGQVYVSVAKRTESRQQAREDLRATELLISKAARSNRTAKMETVCSALSNPVATGHLFPSSTRKCLSHLSTLRINVPNPPQSDDRHMTFPWFTEGSGAATFLGDRKGGVTQDSCPGSWTPDLWQSWRLWRVGWGE